MGPVAAAVQGCRELTARMLEAARGGDWAQVRTLDEVRAPCFSDLDVTDLEAAELDSVLQGFRALMAMDGHLRDLAALARQQALDELRRARGQQRASSRYRELAARP